MGILSNDKPKLGNCLVFSEGWPSWYFALEGLGFEKVSVCPKVGVATMLELQSTRIANHLMKESSVAEMLSSIDWIFVQGSQEFCTYVHNGYLLDHENLKAIYAVNNLEDTTADGLEMSHREVGGVLSGKWSVYAQGTSLSVDTSFHVRRNLKHVLKTTETGSSRKMLELADTPVLTSNMLLPKGFKFPVVRCMSVLKGGNDVLRLMTDSELMAAYDIEEDLQEDLSNHCISEGCRLSRAFVSEAPVKLLRRIGESISGSVIHLNSDKEISNHIFGEDSSYDSDATLKAGNLFSLGDDDTVLDDTVEKAARPDDAEADVEDWDRYSVENFKVTIKKAGKIIPPLVCNGAFDPVHHTRLFNAFRAHLHRRYRKNVTRSFLRYLKTSYPKTNCDTVFNLESETIQISEIEKAASKLRDRGKISDAEVNEIIARFPVDDRGEINYSLQHWTSLKVTGRVAESPKKKRKKAPDPSHLDLLKDLEVGKDALYRAANSSWWDWSSGSTLFFWRWPSRLRIAIRDGTKVFVDKSKLPDYKRKPNWPTDADHCEKLRGKIQKVRDRRYVRPGFVRSLTGYFAVPKAETDIRVVYDATKCGLNDAVWAPNFFLPTVDSILRNACSFTWFGDIDLGEMFLNYFLDEELRPYAGIDVTDLVDDAQGRVFEQWIRTLMGFRCSPYIATQSFAWSEEIVVGDLSDPNNPFAWNEIKLNLPGSDSYNPSMPWIYKWNSVADCMPAFFGTYVDDVRSGASTESMCRIATRRIASVVNYLGQQDAARKRRPPSQTPGPWAGAKCSSLAGDGLYVMSTQGKWNKAQNIISKWKLALGDKSSLIANYKEMESDAGFLCHISRTYPRLFPYLKGFYNSLNSWRFDRDSDGWKVTSKTALMEMISGDLFIDVNLSSLEHADLIESKTWITGRNAPSEIDTVARFKNDIKALSVLLDSTTPPLRLIRGESIDKAIYGFGDASGKGFGSSWEVNGKIIFRFGVWGEEMDGSSSNYKEANNNIQSLETMGKQGLLSGTEIFFFTDNSTAEAVFFNGSSKNESLFDLVLRMHKLEMTYKCKIHFIHCAGKRMIAQGTDGLSRGNLLSGVMTGKTMSYFVPIHKTALERSPGLDKWIRSWTGSGIEFLTPMQWFTRGHDLLVNDFEINVDGFKLPKIKSGCFVWTPPPCLADVAIEELRKARHKRTSSHHLFIVPRLMQPHYLKHLHKAADLIVSLPAGHPAWPISMHEPLTIAFVFPFISHRPWQLRGVEGLLELGRSVLRLWKEDDWEDRHLLRELWLFKRKLSGLSEKLASQMLHGEGCKSVSHQLTRKRRRNSLGEDEGQEQISLRKKRG